MYVQLEFLPLSKEISEMEDSNKSFQQFCLFFTANSLVRNMNKLAEEAFAQTGVAPSYGYLIMQIVAQPGMSQTELSKEMNLMPSTMTRFIEKLDQQQLIRREHKGRMVYIYPTDKGKKFRCEIDKAFVNVYEKYKEILGEEFSAELTSSIYKANLLLEK